VKNEITSLSHLLRSLLLNPSQPFIRTPLNARKALHALMALYPAPFHADSDSTFMPDSPEYEELMSMLENIRISQPAQELPSISTITRFLLYNFAPTKQGSDEIVDPQSWHPGFDENAAVESSVLVNDVESFQKDIVREYIEGLLRANPETEEEALSRLLGYKVNLPRNKVIRAAAAVPIRAELREREERERKIHLERARDILGPGVWEMKGRCEEIGIFNSELSVDQFFQLVNGDDELEDVKRAVEMKMKLRDWDRRGEDGVKWEMGEREE
jgi:hypothetical protein